MARSCWSSATALPSIINQTTFLPTAFNGFLKYISLCTCSIQRIVSIQDQLKSSYRESSLVGSLVLNLGPESSWIPLVNWVGRIKTLSELSPWDTEVNNRYLLGNNTNGYRNNNIYDTTPFHRNILYKDPRHYER